MNSSNEINFLQNALAAVLGEKKMSVSIESAAGSRVYLGSSDSIGALAPFLLIGGEAMFSIMGGQFAQLAHFISFEAGSGGLHCLSFNNEQEIAIAKRYSILSTFSVALDAFGKLYGINSVDNDGKDMIDLPAEVFYEKKDLLAEDIVNLISSGGMDEFISKAVKPNKEDVNDFSRFTSMSI